MKQFFKYAVPALLLISVITACEKEYESIESIDDKNVTAYIQSNKLNVVEYKDSGVYYEVTNAGSGPDVEYSDQVGLVFTLKSLDGKYSALDTFSTFNRYFGFLGYFNPEAVRVGVKEVLKKKSGTVRMIIPSRAAFGRNGSGDIPGNASLDLTVSVLDNNKMGQYEDAVIKKYLATNNLSGFTKTSSGIYYKIADAGTGSSITVDSTISVEYTGKFLNGTVFDKAVPGSAITLILDGFIDAWKEIVPLIKQGGSLQLITPSAKAYGSAGDRTRGMPAFSSLDFTLKVTDVKQ
ncbi:MAG: FKBP-type peptidyl-prolyl cis-trans isomerase [Bacteroidota bacterium]